jgi:hypothetical protein
MVMVLLVLEHFLYKLGVNNSFGGIIFYKYCTCAFDAGLISPKEWTVRPSIPSCLRKSMSLSGLKTAIFFAPLGPVCAPVPLLLSEVLLPSAKSFCSSPSAKVAQEPAKDSAQGITAISDTAEQREKGRALARAVFMFCHPRGLAVETVLVFCTLIFIYANLTMYNELMY